MIICQYKDLKRYVGVIPGLEEALAAVDSGKAEEIGVLPLSGGNRIVTSVGQTTPLEGRKCEAHRQYLDLQYIVEGEETMGWAPLDKLASSGEFNTEGDIGMYEGSVDYCRITAGNCYVVFPEDGHMPAVHLDEPHTFKKMVMKLKV